MVWVKGQSGNPDGRVPTTDTYQACLRRASARKDQDGRTNREAIVDAVMKAAKKGQPWAIQMVMERLEGKAAVNVDISQTRSPLQELPDEELQAAIEFLKQRRLDNEKLSTRINEAKPIEIEKKD